MHLSQSFFPSLDKDASQITETRVHLTDYALNFRTFISVKFSSKLNSFGKPERVDQFSLACYKPTTENDVHCDLVFIAIGDQICILDERKTVLSSQFSCSLLAPGCVLLRKLSLKSTGQPHLNIQFVK